MRVTHGSLNECSQKYVLQNLVLHVIASKAYGNLKELKVSDIFNTKMIFFYAKNIHNFLQTMNWEARAFGVNYILFAEMSGLRWYFMDAKTSQKKSRVDM